MRVRGYLTITCISGLYLRVYEFLLALQEAEGNNIVSVDIVQGNVDIIVLLDTSEEREFQRIHQKIAEDGRIQRVITLRVVDPELLAQIESTR